MESYLKKMQEKMKQKLVTMEEGKKTRWSPESGENHFRVMPSWLGKKGFFYKEVPTHFGLGPDHDKVGKCPGEGCRACKRVAKLMASEDPKKMRRAERMAVQNQIAMNVVDLDRNPKKVLVWYTSETRLQEFIVYFTDSNIGDFYNPKTGYGFTLHKRGMKKQTRYKMFIDKKPSKFKYWKKVKHKLTNLDTLCKPHTNEQIKAIMEGNEDRSSFDR